MFINIRTRIYGFNKEETTTLMCLPLRAQSRTRVCILGANVPTYP